MYKIEEGQIYTMEQFLTTQGDHKEYIQERLEYYSNELRTIVLQACESSLASHGFLTDRELVAVDSKDSAIFSYDDKGNGTVTSSDYCRTEQL